MAGILLYAFAGALLGGIDSPLGAVLGGFAVGVIENLGGAYIVGTELKLTLALLIIGYGFTASVLPVWLLLAPRDYLSTFLKVGTVALLAIGVLIAHPQLQMPAITRFIGAILLEQNDEWAAQRARYMTVETIAPLSDDPIIGLLAVAA